jgi:nucleoside-diphosphate-sugar epimerase
MVVDAAGKKRRLKLPWVRDTVFHFIHVEDAAASLIPLIQASQLDHRVYNAPGFTVTMAELADLARTTLGIDIDFSEPGRAINYVAYIDSTRYESEFGFRPRSLAAWMEEEVAGSFGGAA